MLVKNSGLRVLEFNDGGRIDIGFPGDRRSGLFWGNRKSLALPMIGQNPLQRETPKTSA
jgi:hypothetical protein